eukprot:scaffold6247_cov416-Prasinococcus_capsulatus_cf.AAC.15
MIRSVNLPRFGNESVPWTTASYEDFTKPPNDVKHKQGSCAVVGNSMSLFRKGEFNGLGIDAHDTVVRFNNEIRRIQHVLRDDGFTMEGMAQYIGGRTSFRFLNRKYTNQMLDEEVDQKELLEADHLVFWNLYTVPYLDHLHLAYPKPSMLVMSSSLVNYALEVVAQLRRDFVRLGLGPFTCYRQLSSGLHGILLSYHMCDTIDLYGFSISMENFTAGFNHGKPSESHSWEFETLLMRLLYFAGVVEVCNT